MTKDEIQNSTMFRVMTKALKQKFPWVESLEIVEEDVDKYDTIYPMIVHVDLLKLQEESLSPLEEYIRSGYYFRSSPEGYATSLMMYIDDIQEGREMDDALEDQIIKINNSPAVSEFKLPKKLYKSMYNAKPIPKVD